MALPVLHKRGDIVMMVAFDSPMTYVNFCGATSISLNLENAVSEVRVGDCEDWSLPTRVIASYGAQTVNATVNAQLARSNRDRLLRWAKDQVALPVRLHIVSAPSGEVEYIDGMGMLATLNVENIGSTDDGAVVTTTLNIRFEDGVEFINSGQVLTAPQFTAIPSLLGSTTLGGTITVSLGAASGVPTPALTGTLIRPGAPPIPVTQGQQVTIAPADQGGSLSLTAIATNSEGTDTETVVRIIPAATAPTFARVASTASSRHVHSGHSLVDTYINEGESFPGFLPELFIERFGEGNWVFEGTDYKDTVPGSPMHIRWDLADDERGAVLGIDRYDTLVVTEGGPPFRLGVDGPEGINQTLRYAMYFAENAYRNGNGGAGAESILWSIWPNIHGWVTEDPEDNMGTAWRDLGGFRPVCVEYGRTFRYIAEYVTWKMRQMHPDLPSDWRMWTFPGHAWWVRVYDDIEDALVPGITAHTDLFRDDIHPNSTGSYALAVFMHTLLYQADARPLAYRPTFVSPELDAYFKRIAWEIANSEESVGMGGTDNAAPTFIGGTTPDPMPDYVYIGDPPDVEEPVDPVDPPVNGLLHRIAAPMALTAGNYPVVNLDNAAPAGSPLYLAFRFTPDTQTGREAAALVQLLDTSGAGVLNVVERVDLSRAYVTTSFSENHTTYPWVAADGDLIMEAFIDPALTPAGNVYGYETTTSEPVWTTSDLTLSTLSANRLRFGSPDWGGSIATGTMVDLVVYSRVPSAQERVDIVASLAT